jgi:hypothetical protein
MSSKTMSPSIFKSSRLNSERTSSTVSVSSFAYEGSDELASGPRKPQRSKSGGLEEAFEQGSSAEAPVAAPPSPSQNESSTNSKPVDEDEDDVEEKWIALNDSKPRTIKRRVRRVVRSHSDSDLSEASSIDSSSDTSTTREKVSRKKEIRERNSERQARQDRRKANNNKVQQGGEDGSKGIVANLDEDDELDDTDKESPISEELELALVKKRLERRGKSPLSGRPQSSRRGGKKDRVLSPPKRDNNAGEEPRRSSSFDGRRRRKNQDSADASSTGTKPARTMRSSSADRIRRKRADSGFNMLLGDSQNDSSLNVVPLRADTKRSSSKFTSPPVRRVSLSPQSEMRKEIDMFMDRMKDPGSSRDLTPPEIDSAMFSFFPSDSESSKKDSMLSRTEMMLGTRQAQPDRFLCTATTADFAPRMLNRCLNNSGHDDDAPRKPVALDKFMAEERGKVKSSKKGCARSLDAPKRRKSRKNLLSMTRT